MVILVSSSLSGKGPNLQKIIWVGEITKPAPDLPPFSWLVETSIGKVNIDLAFIAALIWRTKASEENGGLEKEGRKTNMGWQ